MEKNGLKEELEEAKDMLECGLISEDDFES